MKFEKFVKGNFPTCKECYFKNNCETYQNLYEEFCIKKKLKSEFYFWRKEKAMYCLNYLNIYKVEQYEKLKSKIKEEGINNAI